MLHTHKYFYCLSRNAIANCASIMSYNELRFRFVIYEVLPARLHTCTRQLVPVFLSTREMLGFFSYFLAPATSGRVTILLILIAPVMFLWRTRGRGGRIASSIGRFIMIQAILDHDLAGATRLLLVASGPRPLAPPEAPK